MDLTDLQRFMVKVDTSGGPDECWLWTASTNRQGYGWFWDRHARTMRLAHRVAYELLVEPITEVAPKGAGPVAPVVCHSCDNPPCVNPAHLSLGTQASNIADAKAKGRFPDRRGGANGRARLTAADVEAIRSSVTGRRGERSALALKYGVSTSQISKVLLGQSWAA